MDFSDLIQTIEESTERDWSKLEYPTVRNWEWGEKSGKPYIEPNTHTMLAVYMGDIDITLAYGALKKKKFSEPWTNKFSDPGANLIAVTAQYRRQPIKEWSFVTVDGGRYIVPLPQLLEEGYTVDGKNWLPIANLMFGLWGHGGPHKSVEEVLRHANVEVIS